MLKVYPPPPCFGLEFPFLLLPYCHYHPSILTREATELTLFSSRYPFSDKERPELGMSKTVVNERYPLV